MSKASRLSILAAGDFYAAGRPERMSSSELFSGVAPLLESADLRILNFESPLGRPGKPIVKSGPPLIAPEHTVRLLKGRFDVALLANNHTLDYGGAPLLKTIKMLRRNGIEPVGAGKDRKEASQPLCLTVKGFKIGIINACENEFSLARASCPGANGIDIHSICSLIRKLRAGCDAILVFTHGGNEHNPLPSPRVVSMSRIFAEAGASAVVNSHPHMPQGIESWKGSPIVYSLGNFVFDAMGAKAPPQWWIGMPVMLRLCFGKGGVKASVEAKPCLMSPATGRLRLLDKGETSKFGKWLKEVSAPLKDMDKLRAFFEAWSAEHGKGYFQNMRLFSSGDDKCEFAHFRNLWSCEAHNELISTYVELLFQKRVHGAAKLLPRIKKWQRGIALAELE